MTYQEFLNEINSLMLTPMDHELYGVAQGKTLKEMNAPELAALMKFEYLSDRFSQEEIDAAFARLFPETQKK